MTSPEPLHGLLVFAAAGAAALPGARALPSLARAARSIEAGLVLGRPLEAVIAAAALVLHAGLAALFASHAYLLAVLASPSLGAEKLPTLLSLVHASTVAVAASAAVLAAARLAGGPRLEKRCQPGLTLLLLAASLAALHPGLHSLHPVLGAAAAAYSVAAMLRGHATASARALRGRLLKHL